MISRSKSPHQKLHTNQKGFGILEGILFIVVVGLVGGIGWLVWQRQQADNKPAATNQSQADKMTGPRGYVVKEVNVDIVQLSDFEKLPRETPKDFVVALKEKFNKTNADPDQECAAVFTVQKISEINVKASKGWAEIKDGQIVNDSQICGGGTYSIWAFDNGTWIERVAGNDLPACSRLVSPVIYSEFMEECYGEGEQLTTLRNPNGSIANAPRYE